MVFVDADLRPVRQRQGRRQVFLYSRADMDTVKQDMNDFRRDYFSTDPMTRPFSSNWNRFQHAIHTTMYNNIPQKTHSSRYTLPWFSRQLRRQHRKKQRLYKRAQTYNTKEN